MKLRLDAISKTVVGVPHLYEMSLTFSPGINVLLGPTLAGKTSLMRLMAGLDHPTNGRILEDEKDITGLPVQKRNVAFVYQQFINYPSMTIFDNIASPLRVRGGLNKSEITERVHEAAKTMQIEAFLDRLPAALSGGQQQRTAIARALVKESSLLLLDEPLVNLDYKLREELRAEMQNIFAKRDVIVVYSTTEPLEALMLGGNLSVLDQGWLLQHGLTLDVYNNPASQRIGEIFSDPPINLLPATLAESQVALSPEVTFPVPPHMAALTGKSYRIGVRANHVYLHPQSDQDVAVPSWIKLAEISGSETFVHADHRHAGDEATNLVAQLSGVHSFNYGEQVMLYLDPSRLYAFDPGGKLAAAPYQNNPTAEETEEDVAAQKENT